MDTRTIFSKTGKGSLEISKKSIKLASDERQTLILVDGKSAVGDIEEKLSRVSPVRIRAILERLTELDLIREFVTKQGPDSIMPSLGGPTAMKVEELDELDFTALAPVASANTIKEVEERRQAALRAEEEAAKARAEQQARDAADAERRRAEDEQRQREEAARRQREEAERAQREEAERRQREELEARERARREEEAAIRARADAEARARAEAEARARAEEEARRKAEEDARRRAEEEARRKADEEARRRADEERRQREEAERRKQEEAERRAREEAERREREEAERRQREEAERRQREEAERRKQEEAEARERARREEAERAQREELDAREREEARRREAEASERRERARREEEAKRAAIAEEKARRQAEEQEREEAERRQREQTLRDAMRDDPDARANEEAARYTAALTPHLEEASSTNDLDFNVKAPQTGGVESLDLKPLAGGGPDTFADTGMSANSIFQADVDDESRAKRDVEKDARRELEAEAKENAKAAAKAKKEAEKEAKRLAKASKVKVRRGGGGFSLGKFIGIFIVLLIGGGIGYLYFMPIDKSLVESIAGARFGLPIKVGTAKFEPFPPQLKLTDVRIDDIVLPRVTAVPDPGSLAADHKIWNSIDIAGASITVEQLKKLVQAAQHEPPKSATMTVQRVRVTGLSLTGTPVPVPALDANVLFGATTVKQVTLSLPENKAQLVLAREDAGWTVDFESRGVTWPIGPKTAWESVRAKGLAKEDGIRFESIALTHFGGTASGAGDVFWVSGWKFNGNLDVGGMETGSIAQAYYGAQPVSGTMDGKFKVAMAAPTLAALFDNAQLESSVVVNKPAVTNIDLARSGQAGAVTPGNTRFSDFAADLAIAGPKVQIKNIRANSGLLNISGDVAIGADKTLSGTINIELGISSNRSKSVLKLSGTPADPKMSK